MLKSPSNDGDFVKIWIAGETNLCFRVIQPKRGDPKDYVQGELRTIPMSLIDTIKPLNEKTLLIEGSLSGKSLTLETDSMEELSLLNIGLQSLCKVVRPWFAATLEKSDFFFQLTPSRNQITI